jgi:hypothetical protein
MAGLDAGVAHPAEIGRKTGGAEKAPGTRSGLPQETIAGDDTGLRAIAVEHGDDPVDEHLDRLPAARLDVRVA